MNRRIKCIRIRRISRIGIGWIIVYFVIILIINRATTRIRLATYTVIVIHMVTPSFYTYFLTVYSKECCGV
ncbi:hypothetical protein [Oceanobacillus caeni]|nr:hypothetical protein [Oceanobacillus caeni]